MAGCEAAVPLLSVEDDQARTTVWAQCGAPPVAVHLYRCEHGHDRRRATCAEHAPAPGVASCRACFKAGHECPMTAEKVTP